MAEKPRPKGTSSKNVQGAAGSKVPSDSRSPRQGSERKGTWTDEYGRTCYGNECIQLAVDPNRKELVVKVKPGAVCDNSELIESLRKTLGAGARTVYEIEQDPAEPK